MSSSSSLSRGTDSSSFDEGVFGDFNSTEVLELLYVALALSLVSALSSVFIIVTFFKFRRLHTFAYKVIMMLAVANLGLDCAYLVGEVGHDNWKCTAQGFARVYFALVEFALVTSITLTCYLMIVKRQFGIQERFRTVMAYCWLIPLVMACLPFTTNSYGEAGTWCSITAKDLKSLEWGTFWRFSVIYAPLWICVGINAYMCVKVYRAMRGLEAAMVAYADSYSDEEEEEGEGEEMSEDRGGEGRLGEARDGVYPAMGGTGRGGAGGSRRGGMRRGAPSGVVESSTSMPIINRLRLYPIALVVCWSFATANRVREAIEPYAESLFWLYILQYTFQTMQGFLNLVIFLRTPSVMEEWKDEIIKWKWTPCRRVTSVDGAALLTTSSSSDSK